MKNILSSAKTLIILLVVTVLFLAMYACMMVRPISYGLSYCNETVYDGDVFEGKMKFYSDGTMVNENTNFEEKLVSRYYYKDGYVFYLFAETDEEYAEEVASINENFDEAIVEPFYADEINALRLIATENDGYETVYTCIPAIVIAIVCGVFGLMLIGLTAVSFILWKKGKN